MAQVTLAVHVEPDEDGEARGRLAARLARRLDAFLVGIAARDITPPVTSSTAGPVIVAALLASQEETIQAELEEAQRQFLAVTRDEGCPTEWRASIVKPSEMLAGEARGADLLIVGRKPDAVDLSRSRHADPGDVLMRAGRPILVVPPGMSSLDTSHVVVAWKETRESRRALADALPLLKLAESTAVVAVCDTVSEQEVADTAVQDVLQYLARHGVQAVADVRLLREATASAELLLAAERHGADLIVAGGYGHSRLQEWIFGGVTRTLLHHCPKCCLLSH